MSWPLASFAIVLGVLFAGWLIYERSRPSARMAAIVGTLAAIAALGRDAFVALPDVKPITAITLVVGYALGPLPGFTVGAMGMLASNILLGQGPYTPWQMAAWGLVGLMGALLARLSRRRVGRLGLALACAFTALVAKEIMNVYTWTLGASHTPAAFLLVAGAALPFDLTDAIASFFFGLAFGPELARLLGRMRARMTVVWEAVPDVPLTLLAMLVACAAATALLGQGAARASSSQRIARAVAFLEGAQKADGGFGEAAGQRSSELYSAWAAIGFAAAGRDALLPRRAGHDVLDAIDREAATLEGAGDLERTMLALRACGVSARKLGARDLVAQLRRYRAPDGSFSNLVNLTAFAVLALRAAGEPASDPVVRAAALWLARQQNADGGFSYAVRGGAPDVDDTAAALQGVVAASVPAGPVVARAVSFLAHAQNSDGGYPQQPGGESNGQSTAWAVQGLVAAGRDPGLVKSHGHSPVAYLEGLLAPNGSVRYSSTSAQTPVWVTAEALAALARKPFPIAPAPAPSVAHAVSHSFSVSAQERAPSRPPSSRSPGSAHAVALGKGQDLVRPGRVAALLSTLEQLLSVVSHPIEW